MLFLESCHPYLLGILKNKVSRKSYQELYAVGDSGRYFELWRVIYYLRALIRVAHFFIYIIINKLLQFYQNSWLHSYILNCSPYKILFYSKSEKQPLEGYTHIVN